jgi:hypothetical protein
MCIPIELDVPVMTLDLEDVGTAREIACPCPGDSDAGVDVSPIATVPTGGDLWLRVERPGRPDLYIPFVEIAETWADGVRLRVTAEALGQRDWERLPHGFPVPVGVA